MTAQGTPAVLLEARGVTKRFGGLVAVSRVDLDLRAGETLGLIGPNGAGKSTLFNLLSGFASLTAGTVTWRGTDITRLSPHRIAALGLARTFQHAHVFASLTVRENVLIGAHLDVIPRARDHVSALLRLPGSRSRERAAAERADAVMADFGLLDRATTPASDLTFGEVRKLGIAIAALRDPVALLLDEPAAGLNPTESAALVDGLRRIGARGTSLLVVEHDMTVVMGLCDRIVVLDYGRKIFDGTPAEAQRDPGVLAAYLGTEAA